MRAFAYLGTFFPLRKIKRELGYENYSAVPLLGIDGVVMVCHGKSNSKSIENSIRITKKYLGCNVNSRLTEEISKYGK